MMGKKLLSNILYENIILIMVLISITVSQSKIKKNKIIILSHKQNFRHFYI